MKRKIKIGIIGCGNISDVYMKNSKIFNILDLIACTDIDINRAKEKAREYNIKACTVKDILSIPEIEIVLNLTTSQAHGKVGMQILSAGKHLYSEKPLAPTREEAKKMLKLAKQKNLLIGCAPDTFLGGGLQTCRKLIDDGVIGKPTAFSAFMMHHGVESWHPNPEFFYQPGSGPMFESLPYYLNALINLIGPINTVMGYSKITFPTRIIKSKQKYGQKIKVNTTTHMAGIMNFVNGIVGTMMVSYDVWNHKLPPMEIYGTEATLSVSNPYQFGGSVSIYNPKTKEWQDIKLLYGYTEMSSRGIGVADMAYAIIHERKHRANSDMAYHVLDIIHSFFESFDKGMSIKVKSICERPYPLVKGWEKTD